MLLGVTGALTAAGPASALASKAEAPGQVTCSFSARVTFSPSLTDSGGGTGVSPVTARLSSCSTSDSTVTVTSGRAVGSFTSGPLSCVTGSTTGASVTLRVSWQGSDDGKGHVAPSRVSDGTSTGSFAGPAQLGLSPPSGFSAACSGKRGIRRLTVTGTISVGIVGGGDGIDLFGGVQCSFAGTVDFSPPVSTSGGGTSPSSIDASLSGCTVSENDYPVLIPQGTLVGDFAASPLSCVTDSSTGAALSGTVSWPGSEFDNFLTGDSSGRPLAPTTITDNATTGSFAGTTTLTMDVPPGFASSCASPGGLASASVTGSVVFGPYCGPGSGPISIYPISGTDLCGARYEPLGITSGPDGALWFTDHDSTFGGSSTIGRITTSGVVTIYSDPSIQNPTNITVGSDGSLWFTNEFAAISNGGSYSDASIGRITTSGVVTNFASPSIDGPMDIAAGSDGALWFTNQGYCQSNGLCGYGQSIGRITTSGVITTFSLPSTDFPNSITAGPDGALWFTNIGNNTVGRITTSGVITTYSAPSISVPEDITAGPDGALWFTNGGNNSIGRITTSGVVTNFTGAGISGPFAITNGPDGALWFTDYGGSIGRITTSGVVTTYAVPGGGPLYDITTGPDGALWFVNSGSDTVGRLAP